MTIHRRSVTFSLLLSAFLFLLFVSVPVVRACGPFFTRYIFMPDELDGYYPFVDHEKLFGPDPGLIMTHWGPEYLYPVYMTLSGKPLSQEIRKDMLPYLSGGYEAAASGSGVARWLDARAKVVKEMTEISIEASVSDTYSVYTSCTPHAFDKAAETITDRSSVYSEDQLLQWLKRQDDVFKRCSTPLDTKRMLALSKRPGPLEDVTDRIRTFFRRPVSTPTEKPLGADELLSYDADYQSAAASFYANEFAEAERKFTAISQHPKNPWRAYAALIVARIYARKAEFTPDVQRNTADAAKKKAEYAGIRTYWFTRALRQIDWILTSSGFAEAHPGATDLRAYILYRLDPMQRLQMAEQDLLNATDSYRVITAIEDLSTLWIPAHTDVFDEGASKREIDTFRTSAMRVGGDFITWLLVWGNDDDGQFPVAYREYGKHKSLPWLLAAVRHLRPGVYGADTIETAVKALPKDSPGFVSASIYLARYLLTAGKPVDAIAVLDSMGSPRTPVVANTVSRLRMFAGKSLPDVFGQSLRAVVATTVDTTYREFMKVTPPKHAGPILDDDIVALLNSGLPISRIIDVATDPALFTPEIRTHLTLTAFVRAAVLGQWDQARRAATWLSSHDTNLRSALSSFLSAKDVDSQRFEAVVFMLAYPGVGVELDDRYADAIAGSYDVANLDAYRRNWWCTGGQSLNGEKRKPKEIHQLLAKLVSDSDRQAAAKEVTELGAVVAPNFIASEVIRYARLFPADTRVPKALHDTVIATKIPMCSDKQTTEFSKSAFEELHKGYEGSVWAKQTPYWY